jgi:hypothetical protein
MAEFSDRVHYTEYGKTLTPGHIINIAPKNEPPDWRVVQRIERLPESLNSRPQLLVYVFGIICPLMYDREMPVPAKSHHIKHNSLPPLTPAPLTPET